MQLPFGCYSHQSLFLGMFQWSVNLQQWGHARGAVRGTDSVGQWLTHLRSPYTHFWIELVQGSVLRHWPLKGVRDFSTDTSGTLEKWVLKDHERGACEPWKHTWLNTHLHICSSLPKCLKVRGEDMSRVFSAVWELCLHSYSCASITSWS